MGNLNLLFSEITSDPEGLGYAGLTDEQAAALLNNKTLGRTRYRPSI